MTAAQIPTQSRTALLREAEGRAVLSLLGLVRRSWNSYPDLLTQRAGRQGSGLQPG